MQTQGEHSLGRTLVCSLLAGSSQSCQGAPPPVMLLPRAAAPGEAQRDPSRSSYPLKANNIWWGSPFCRAGAALHSFLLPHESWENPSFSFCLSVSLSYTHSLTPTTSREVSSSRLPPPLTFTHAPADFWPPPSNIWILNELLSSASKENDIL